MSKFHILPQFGHLVYKLGWSSVVRSEKLQSSTVRHSVKRKSKLWTGILLLSGFAASSAGFAKELVIPNQVVSGVDTGYTGYAALPSFQLMDNYFSTDTLSVQVSGTVDMYSGKYTVNAAGVIVSPNPTYNNYRPGQVLYTTTNHTSTPTAHGTLLIGNSSIGFFPLFKPSVATGLDSALPPTTLSLVKIPLSEIFANARLVNGVLPRGTTLELRINEQSGNYGDNSGSLTVTAPVCEGRGMYDGVTQVLKLPFVDVIKNKSVMATVSTNLTLLPGSTNLFNLQTVAEVVPAGRGTIECHATYDMNADRLQIPFVDVSADWSNGYPAMTYEATLHYRGGDLPKPNYDFVITESHTVND